MEELLTIKAKIRLKTTAEGGRMSGIATNYRPNHVFEYDDGKLKGSYIGQIEFEKETIDLGVDEIVTIRFINHNLDEKFKVQKSGGYTKVHV